MAISRKLRRPSTRMENLPIGFRWAARDIAVLRLRARLPLSRREEAPIRTLRSAIEAMATSLGYEGHMEWAEAMP